MPTKCRFCQIELNAKNCPASFLERGFTVCRRCNQKEGNERYQRYKTEIITRLGGKCKCCKTTIRELLSIDHIYGGGHQESKICRGKAFSKKLYRMPLEDLFDKYQCLCFNCNYAKGFWGCCPHTFNTTPTIPNNPLWISNRGVPQTHLSKEDHKARKLQLRQINRLKIRLEMILAYGNECFGCHETHPLFLTLDHIHNNGSMEDERGAGFYQFLKRLGYPGKNTQLQLLCHNCNALKEYQNNRKHKSETIKAIAEIYLLQPYTISESTDEELWGQARSLFQLITNQNLVAGINALNASVLEGSTSDSALSRSPDAKLE